MQAEELPNFEEHPLSPEVEDLGVQIRLIDTSAASSEPLVIRGAYQIDWQLSRKYQGTPLANVLILVVGRDEPWLGCRVVQDAHNVIPEPADPEDTEPEGYREGGYFNLDLIAHCEIDEPGRYWVMASLGDYVSERIEFEVLSDSLRP